MNKKVFSLALFVGVFYGCLPVLRVNIKGRYFLETDDLGKYLGYEVDEDKNCLTLVDHYVFAAGYSDKFIVAIQHPKTNEGMSADSNYYIVPFHSDYTDSPQDGIVGPLTLKEYNLKKDQLRVGPITWKKLD
jgi:hypothetical protein